MFIKKFKKVVIDMNNYGYIADIIYKPSFVRVLHASPDAPNVDIYVNDELVYKDLAYKKFTPYLPLKPDQYNVKVYATGTKINPVIDATLDVLANQDYTVAATGMLKDIKPLVVHDTAMLLKPNNGQIKFVHLSPNAPAVDITLPDGTVLFNDIEYKETSNNLEVPVGNYTIQARVAGTDKVVLTVPNVLIRDNKYYTIYAVGLVGDEPPLQALIALDKASY